MAFTWRERKMRDPRCLIGYHKWVGKRRSRDQQTESLWDVADDQGYVIWCQRCGKNRSEGLAGMAGFAEGM